MPPSKHFKLSPSAAHRWMVCPGEVKVRQLLPKVASSSYANEGTTAHKLAEDCLRRNVDPHTFVGKTLKETGHKVTAEMADHVQMYIDFVKKLGKGVVLEAQFASDINKDLGGTCDAVVFDRTTGTLAICDLKYGQGIVVDAIDNPQLAIYLYLARGAMKPAEQALITKYQATIVQPRADHDDGPIRTWEMSPEEFGDWAQKINEGLEAVKKTPNKFVPGEHCHFCPGLRPSGGRTMCPAKWQQIVEAAQTEFLEPVVKMPDIVQLSDDQLVRIMEAEDTLAEFFKGVKHVLENRLRGGEQIPGVKMVKKRTNRAWIDEKVAARTLHKHCDMYTEPKIISPAQAEKQLDKETKKLVEKLTHKPDAGDTIALASDPRPAVLGGSAVQDFLPEADFLQ